MPNNHFKKGELYSFITGKASTAIARRLQKKFNSTGMNLTIEQWSVLYHLWKQEGISQQELCNATFRDKPSITRLVDNLEKLNLVKRVASENDRRINLIYLTKQAQKLQEETMVMAEETLKRLITHARLATLGDEPDLIEDGALLIEKDRIAALDSVATALFSEWKTELKQYTSDSLRSQSEAQYKETLDRYQKLTAAMTSGRLTARARENTRCRCANFSLQGVGCS